MNQQRYAYLLGANGPESMRLQYAETDVTRLAEVLKGPHCQFTDTKAVIASSRNEGLAGFQQFAECCGPSDLLLVHFSGHAFFDEQLYLLCNTTDPNDLNTAIDINAIKRVLRKSRAQYKLLILDCCHAKGAYEGALKGGVEIHDIVKKTAQGSATVVLSACARNDQTREFSNLDGGSGFLTWTIREACSTYFTEASGDPDQKTLSLGDLERWIEKRLRYVNTQLNAHPPLPTPYLYRDQPVGAEIWFTPPPFAERKPSPTKTEEDRRRYLEQMCRSYSSVTLPIGPADGLSLQTMYQPLVLRRDPSAAEDLERTHRRKLLGERAEATRTGQHETSQAWSKLLDENMPESPVIAEHGEDALNQSPRGRMVVLGGPGTGKTTTLKHLVSRRVQQALAQTKEPSPTLLPIFLSLPDLALSGKTLQGFLVDLVERLRVDKSFANVLWAEIERGNAFVALDGLDEVAPTQRPQIIELINGLASEQGNIWLVGSRFTEYKGGQLKRGQFTEWELLSLTPQLRRELAERLVPALSQSLVPGGTAPVFPSEFVRLIETHPQAAAWGENPLLFSLAAAVFVKKGGLPASRASLYRDVIEATLVFKEPDSIARRHLLRTLTKFSLWLYQEKKGRTFTLDDLLTFVEDMQRRSWEEAESIAKKITTSGVLDIVAHEIYGFRHQTFQEYLAAAELAQQLTSRQEKRKETREFVWGKRTYNRWTEVLRLMVGVLIQLPGGKGRAEAAYWLNRLVMQRTTEEGDPGDLGLTLAITSLSEIGGIEAWERDKTGQIVYLEKRVVILWAQELLDAARNQRTGRLERFQRLGRDIVLLRSFEKEAIIEYLIQAVKDPNGFVQNAATEVLENLGRWIPLARLLLFLNDSNARVREAAVRVLGGLGEDAPVEHLLPLLNDNDQEWRVRRSVMVTLGKLGRQAPLDRLLSLLEDPNELVRAAAVEALGNLGERAPLERLLLFLEDPNWRVRAQAVETLAELGERAPVEHLLPLLDDPHFAVREAAVREARRWLGERVPLERVLPLLDDQMWEVHYTAMGTLASLGERVPLELLLSLLEGPNYSLRREAIQLLGSQGERAPVELLLSQLDDPDVSIQEAALGALGRLGERTPVERLLSLLERPNSFVRATAVQVLGNLGEHTPVERLLLFLEDPDAWVRGAALEALGNLGERAPVERVLSLLEDRDYGVRGDAVRALESLGEWAPVERLLSLLDDQNYSARATVVRALGSLGERVPVERLLLLLEDADRWIRREAVEALGNLGERVPVERLLPLLDDPDAFVREDAVLALTRFGERAPVERVLSLYQRSDWLLGTVEQALEILIERVPPERLLPLLEHADSDTCRAAMRVLECLSKREQLAYLLPLLEDPDAFVRRTAVQALTRLGAHVPIDPMLSLLEDPGIRVCEAAVEYFKGAKVPLSLKSLQRFFYSSNRWTVESAVTLAEVLDIQVSQDILLDLLSHVSDEVRRTTFRIAKKQHAHLLSDLALHALKTLDGQVSGYVFETHAQSYVAAAIGIVGGASAMFRERLTALLDWPHWRVRAQAAYALGQLRRNIPDAAIQRLRQLRRDSDPRMHTVRKFADDALAEILSLETGNDDDSSET